VARDYRRGISAGSRFSLSGLDAEFIGALPRGLPHRHVVDAP